MIDKKVLKKNGIIGDVSPLDLINYLTEIRITPATREEKLFFCNRRVSQNQLNNFKNLIKGNKFVLNNKNTKMFELYSEYIYKHTTRIKQRIYLLGEIKSNNIKKKGELL